jgi:hypothetical protein
METVKQMLDKANPNSIPDYFRVLALGGLLRGQISNQLFLKAPAADPLQLVAVQSIKLAEDGKALTILSAYARAGAGTPGPLSVVAAGTTPVAGEVAVAANGDLVFAAADAWTSVDVAYEPAKYDIAEFTLPVDAGGILTIPADYVATGVLSAEVTKVSAGSALGGKIVLAAGAAPAAGQAALSADKATVVFAVADAATEAKVKLALVPKVDFDAIMSSSATF